MTIFEFEQIYDKEDKTAEDVDLISDVMERCGEQSDDNFLSRELLRKQALLHAAILEVEAGNKKSFAPQMEQYNRAKLELENYRKEKEEEIRSTSSAVLSSLSYICSNSKIVIINYLYYLVFIVKF